MIVSRLLLVLRNAHACKKYGKLYCMGIERQGTAWVYRHTMIYCSLFLLYNAAAFVLETSILPCESVLPCPLVSVCVIVIDLSEYVNGLYKCVNVTGLSRGVNDLF